MPLHAIPELAKIRQHELLREAELHRIAASARPARGQLAPVRARRLVAVAAAVAVCVIGSLAVVLGIDVDALSAAIRLR